MSTGKADQREDTLAAELRRWVQAIEASGRSILPDSGNDLLQTIVEAAARLFGAAASSIALLDETQQTLQFRVATGAGAEEVVGMRIPVGEGIAGYVVMTGQPLAVSSVQEDPRFARETARKTGYVPRSILAMPLLYEDRAIGVIEVLDKIEAASFGLQDMELLGIFARQAAIAIRASVHYQHLGQALLWGIRRLAEEEGVSEMPHLERALAETEPAFGGAAEILALADILSTLSRVGQAERQACLDILTTFAEYAQSRSRFAR
jgi:GAF domain-containing protein